MGLLFINKTQSSTSLSQSVPDEYAVIQRFVQTDRKRARNARAPPKSNFEHPLEPDIAALTAKTIEVKQPASQRPDKKRVNSKSAITSKCKHNVTSFPDLHQVFLPTLVCHNISSSHDPFNTSSMTIDESATNLLHYYVDYYHPSQWPNEMALLRHGVYFYQDSVTRIMKDAVADPLTMLCILAAAASRLQFIDRVPCVTVKNVEGLYIRGAMDRLASASGSMDLWKTEQLERYVTYIMLLGAAEYYRGNGEAARAHSNTLRQLLAPRGGLVAISNESLRGQVAMGDLALACLDLRPCDFECSYDPGPASTLNLEPHELRDAHRATTTCTAISLLQRSTTSISMSTSRCILSTLHTLIADIHQTYTIKNTVDIPSLHAPRALQITHWLTTRNMAIRNNLLALPLTDLKTHALRVTLIMWTLLSMNITGRAKTTKAMAPKLKGVLEQISLAEWEGNEDVHLWIVIVGAQCAGGDSIEALWFVSEFVGLCVKNDRVCTRGGEKIDVVELRGRLEMFQRGFLYDPEVQRSRTHVLAEKLYKFMY